MSAPAPMEDAAAAKGPSKSELKKMEKEAAKAKKAAEVKAKQDAERAAREAAEPDDAAQNYGQLPLHQSSKAELERQYTSLRSLSKEQHGQTVSFLARISNSRVQTAKMAFFELRQDGWPPASVQALFSKTEGVVSKQMIKFATALPTETLVYVEGTVEEAKTPIRSTTVQDVEIKVTKCFVAVPVTAERLPFTRNGRFEEQPPTDPPIPAVTLNTRLENRVFDFRVPVTQAIFRLSSAVEDLFRSYLKSQGFLSIHSPKLQGAATESGASVFTVEYFSRKAFLAQSPQLAKQECIAGGFSRVYEIGPVFRAENSMTARHMTEFMGLLLLLDLLRLAIDKRTGLDLEMEITQHYHEAVDLIDAMLRSIFRGLQSEYRAEIDLVRTAFPVEDFVFPEKTVRLTFNEGVKLLSEDGWVDDARQPQKEGEDLSTPAEKRLGAIVKSKYNTDYYILDKFPIAARPFYTMPDAENPELSNSYDFFMRGQEILSGAQRVHDATVLEKRMREVGINPADMSEYLDAFKLACPPHAGGGIGLERVVMLFLGLPNIRYSSLFPRDPRSFATVPPTAPGIAEAQATTQPPS